MKNSILLCNCIILLLLLALPAVVQAQFTFITNNDLITITGYSGPGGAVVIPSTTNGYAVTIIGNNAFAYCTNVTSVVIPGSITNIGIEPFLGCASLTNISVESGNPSYSSLNGVLFDAAQDTLIDYPAGLTNGTYIFPSRITSIGQYAFASCFRLTSIAIPSQVNTIGQFAFSECTGLTSVTTTNIIYYPEWVGTTNVGMAAFAFCTSLTNVVIAGTVTNLGELAFAFCTNLTSAYFLYNAPPDAGNAFYGDPDAVVYYPPGTTGWGTAFGDAPTAEASTPPTWFNYEVIDGSITITGYIVDALTISPRGIVLIPSTINGYTVTSIDGFDEAEVTNVTIPSSVTNIGPEAFQNCTYLTNVTIGNSVTSIGENAFANCSRLTSVTIPSSVTSIEEYAFSDCSSLTSAYFQGNAPPNVGDIFFGDPVTVYYLPGTIGWGATFGGAPTVGETPPSQFGYVTNDNSIIITGCAGSDGVVVIPSAINGRAVTSIEEFAFFECTNLTSVTIPSSVTSIGAGAFADCTSLTSVYFDGNAPPDFGNVFENDPATVYYLPGTTGWGATFGGVPAVLWNPQATVFTTVNKQFGFNITGPTNATIVVQACTNLANPVWLPVSTNTFSASGKSSFSDPQWTNFPNRYYRFSGP